MPKSTFDRQSLSRAKCFVEEVSLYSLQESVRHQKVRTLYEVRHLLLCSAFPLLCPSQVRLAPPTADHAAEKKRASGSRCAATNLGLHTLVPGSRSKSKGSPRSASKWKGSKQLVSGRDM